MSERRTVREGQWKPQAFACTRAITPLIGDGHCVIFSLRGQAMAETVGSRDRRNEKL